jgi:hypothetical protein
MSEKEQAVVTTLEFEAERETKNCIRFQEVQRPGQPQLIGTLYVQRWAVPAGANRLFLAVSFEPFRVALG